MEINKSSKIPPKFCCELCHYFTCYSKDYKKHELTKKHMEMNGTLKEMKKVLICKICEKEFKTNAGLWKHKQKCNSQPTNTIITKQDEPSDKEVMCMLIKQNSELIKEHSDIKEMILEIIKNGLSL